MVNTCWQAIFVCLVITDNRWQREPQYQLCECMWIFQKETMRTWHSAKNWEKEPMVWQFPEKFAENWQTSEKRTV